MCHHMDDRSIEIVELTDREDTEDEPELSEESDDPVAATADD